MVVVLCQPVLLLLSPTIPDVILGNLGLDEVDEHPFHDRETHHYAGQHGVDVVLAQ